ncbi:GAF and ANTAR domain-containing protein [Streptomyces sp. FXJ1.172]|uniref:GAF and ANTAR domain-containing protein n=1 Tax=Streptomyces sp. FXJ1.172 TaxID=710705 RepID=UPI000AF2A319|nr:GAF and ANTAR domain-containing protein [Streptomyces sp. FXJ1.172]WEO93037.1 GAF and ANTAR domain-containing protein [Streptomyces sp. FXJ1.172]
MLEETSETPETPSIVHDVSVAAAVGRGTLPRRLCIAFAEGMGAQRAALSLLPSLDHWQLLHATDESALLGEAVQFTLADGPSINAALEMRPVLVSGLQNRRSTAGSHMADEVPDVQQVLALPLNERRTPIGVMSLYYTRSTQVTVLQLGQAQRAAGVALDALLRWRRVHASSDSQRPVWKSDTRAARWHRIHQAAGLVAACEDCSRAEALAWLQAVSARDGLSLLEVADSLLQPSSEDEPGLRRQGSRAAETVCRA